MCLNWACIRQINIRHHCCCMLTWAGCALLQVQWASMIVVLSSSWWEKENMDDQTRKIDQILSAQPFTPTSGLLLEKKKKMWEYSSAQNFNTIRSYNPLLAHFTPLRNFQRSALRQVRKVTCGCGERYFATYLFFIFATRAHLHFSQICLHSSKTTSNTSPPDHSHLGVPTFFRTWRGSELQNTCVLLRTSGGPLPGAMTCTLTGCRQSVARGNHRLLYFWLQIVPAHEYCYRLDIQLSSSLLEFCAMRTVHL